MKTAAFQKTYGSSAALIMPPFEFEPGLIYAVTGPNGSGKSTLARTLAGACAPDGGGRVTDGAFLIYSPQRPYIFKMSVIKNVLLGLRGPDAYERARSLMADAGIDGLAKKRADTLSGGEVQRMALARAFMRDADVLILDEPTAAMDVDGTLCAERLILRRRDETGCAVILVTHSAAQVRRIADRLLFLMDGRLAEYGPADELLRHPRTEALAGWLDFCR